jgi:hypothetical protein
VLSGCVRSGGSAEQYARILDPAGDAAGVRERLAPPRGACLSAAGEYLGDPAVLFPAPLPPPLRDGLEMILDGLHPIARRVLARSRGIWPARRLDHAAAVFLTCDVDLRAGAGGFVLLDASRFPLERPLRDAEVPALYWRALAGDTPPTLGVDDPLLRVAGSIAVPPGEHAARYLVLHELGHALSLYAGEFTLDAQRRMQVGSLGPFARLSWELVTADRRTLPVPGGEDVSSAVVPLRVLGPVAWGILLDAVGVDADGLAPGYALARARRRPASARARDLCDAVRLLPRAGFVTPTAARYPTEDYAEVFAHALLAAEGRLLPSDRLPLDLPGCDAIELASPYFSAGLAPKRAYIERALGLRPGI